VDQTILPLLIRIVVVAFLTAFFQWMMNTINNKITYQVVQDIRNEAFEKIQNIPLKYIDAQSHGDIVSRVIADVDQFADGLLMGFTQLFTGVVTILATLLFMFSINIWIAFVVVLLTPLSLFVARFISGKTYHLFLKQSETRGEQTSLVEELVGNQQVVKAYHHEKEAMEQFDEINERLAECSLQATFFSSLTNPVTRFLNSVVYAGVGLTGAYFAIGGMLTVGELSCFLSYANQYTKPFNEISGVITELQNALACAARVFALIEEEPERETEVTCRLQNATGKVDLEHVSFSYVPEKN
jgi:ATP-binding cassette subfamily B protein